MIELVRPVRRKVVDQRRKPLVIEAAPEGLWIREPRRRTKYLLPWGHALLQAAKLHADAVRRLKVAQRKARAAERRAR